MNNEFFHDIPKPAYDRLVQVYGEEKSETEVAGRKARWVLVGAGSFTLAFFPATPAKESE